MDKFKEFCSYTKNYRNKIYFIKYRLIYLI